MKGVVLAGGIGSRLYPLTKYTNKTLLPVYNQPMIYYPLQTLSRSGIEDVLLVTNPVHDADFKKILGAGNEFNVNLTYVCQAEPKGCAHALGLAESFVDGDNLCLIFGDNIFEDVFDISDFVCGARVFVKQVGDPRRFGVVEFGADNLVKSIEEKPKNPKSDYAVTGGYFYDSKVFDIVKTLRPSNRGELEITDINNYYLERGDLTANFLTGFWSDAGTFDSLLEISQIIKQKLKT